MIFESDLSILYSDTQVPDIFVTEFMPSMDGDFVKIYIHCLFLNKRNKPTTPDDIAKKLDIDISRVKEALTYLDNLGVIRRVSNNIIIVDLKEKEIKRVYRPKTTSTPAEAVFSSERNKKRNSVIRDINNKFFQAVMSPSWYTDIDAWFDKYHFEEDVMFALFEHCYNHKGLAKQYITKVAESWNSKNIKNHLDLDKYSNEYQKLKDIRTKIMKKIRKQGFFTEYEENYIEKWVMEYNFDFEIIELALKKTTATLNPNFEYINKILTEWHERGFRTKEEIAEYDKVRKQSQAAKSKISPPVVPQKGNFKQREYDDEYFNKLYKDV
jgi:DnaD/phage-associated family protein